MASASTRLAVIGCGYWGKNLVRNFAALGVLSAVHDQQAEAAANAGAMADVPVMGWDGILEDGGIAAVAIATPAATHSELAIAALEAGKHVFVEKPLALLVPDAEQVVKVAQETGKRLMVGHLLRYHPAFVELEAIVRAGTLGELRYIYSNRLNFGRFRRVEDILWSFAPHDISMILSLVGDEPDSVTAVSSSYLQEEIADVTTTHLAFPKGVAAHVFVSWLHPFKEQKLVVVGDRAMAVFDDGEPWRTKLRIYDHEVEWTGGVPEALKKSGRNVPVDEDEPLLRECRHFLHCIETGASPLTDGFEGIRVLKVLQRAQASMTGTQGGEPAVELDDYPDGAFVHPTAVIDPGARLGAGTKVWHFSHVLSGTQIGAGCTLGQNVMVGPDVVIGDNCKIQNNVSVYKGVTFEDDVFCGPSAVFTNVLTPRAEIDRTTEFAPTIVREGATIGANATVVCGNEVGAYSLVGAGAVVTSDVGAHALVVGNPARQIGWVGHHGERLDGDLVCPVTGRRYEERNGRLFEKTDG